ncbi:MAG: threonine/serine exporter family protein [Bacillota bacterium]|nr:threonine/serine exporter family protein [Bacillota bacterium]
MIEQWLFAMIGVWAFAVLFHAPKKCYLSCAINGAIGWICYLCFKQLGASIGVSTMIASILLTIVSRILAVVQKEPVTIFLVTGIFPLVPGAGIYYTAYYFIQKDCNMGANMTLEVLTFAGAIALGIIIGSILPQKLFSKLSK